MTHFRPLFWSFICFTSLKVIQTAKIYVVDVPYVDDIAPDNYDSHYYFENNYEKHLQPTQSMFTNKHKIATDTNRKKQNLHKNLYQRLFGIMYGNNIQQMKRLESQRDQKAGNNTTKQRSDKSHPAYDYYNKRTRDVYESVNMNDFSQDYLDVKDLIRSKDRFADNYVDVDDFRAFEGFRKVPPIIEHAFRKASDNAEFRGSHKHIETTDSSDSSESDEYVYKPSRYKVISDDDPKRYSPKPDSGDSDDGKEDRDFSDEDKVDANYSEEKNAGIVANVDDEASDMDMEGDTSIELTTRRPKPKSKGNEKYVYLQGNNMIRDGDFRRRFSYFLPKSFHWDEDEYLRLGTFWFNGPRGMFRGS